MSTTNSKVSFDLVNKQLEQMLKPKDNRPAKSIVDEQGIYHTFPTHGDYMTYLDNRDLELMSRN